MYSPEYHKQYREKNKELLKIRKKEEYIRHKDSYLTRSKKYYLENKEEINKKNRERSKALPNEYKIWRTMKNRCNNKNMASYKNYGERGIKVCERWLESFENFFKDMGNKPTKSHSIDRIDNDGNYEPSNCRWATKKEQGNNRKNNIMFKFKGMNKSITQWADYYGVPRSKIFNKLRINKTKKTLTLRDVLKQYETNI